MKILNNTTKKRKNRILYKKSYFLYKIFDIYLNICFNIQVILIDGLQKPKNKLVKQK